MSDLSSANPFATERVSVSSTTGSIARSRRRAQSSLLPYLLILPTFIFVTAFTLLPTLNVLHDSLFRQNQAVRVPRFVGLENFANLLDDPGFHKVLGNTLLFVVGTVPLSMALAFGMALLLNQHLRGLALYRLAFFYPTILPMVSAATIWLFMYAPEYGLVNELLRVGGVRGPNWLGDPSWVLPAFILMAVWKQAGYYMVFYLAGLQGLSSDYFEAAQLDGASWWHTIRHITFPLLMGTTLFVTTIAVVASFQTADQIYVMTAGGPDNASNLLLFDIYETNFRFQDHGSASALSVVLVLILLVFTVLNFRVVERRVTYD